VRNFRPDRQFSPKSCRSPAPGISISIELSLDARVYRKHDVSMKLETASFQLEALGNSVRLTVYRLLVRAGAEGLPVGSIQEKLGVAASTLSHHLKRLVEAGLVTQERQGTTLLCRAHFPAMSALIGYLSDECCADGKTTPACAPTSARAKAGR
jgi:ArsR family transcriptional regulator, arsenate/arsenite/antimonite-responsive transcriptional repressor